jgi:hypothetical protein
MQLAQGNMDMFAGTSTAYLSNPSRLANQPFKLLAQALILLRLGEGCIPTPASVQRLGCCWVVLHGRMCFHLCMVVQHIDASIDAFVQTRMPSPSSASPS